MKYPVRHRIGTVFFAPLLGSLSLGIALIILAGWLSVGENATRVGENAIGAGGNALPRTITAASASVTGHVQFKGPAPRLERAKCTTPEVCGKTQSYDRLLLDNNGGVQYALIYIENPPAGRFANFGPPTITQEHCKYSPHMALAARGSYVTFLNNDPVLHNCHGYSYIGSDRSTAFNFAQPMQGASTTQSVRKNGMLDIECDAGHTWMSGWVWVTDNPYTAITNEHGDFTLSGLPPGTYTIAMWHEGWKPTSTLSTGRPVFSAPILERQQISVSPNGSTSVNFILQ